MNELFNRLTGWSSVWPFYVFAAVGALAIYLLLPRPEAPPAGGRRFDLRGAGLVAGAAALGGLILWMIRLHRLYDPMEPAGPLVSPYFYLFAAIALVTAVKVIVHPRPIYSVVYFVTTVLAVAGMLLLANAQFLAIGLVLVYAGAVLVTFVFVVMLAQHVRDERGGQAVYDVRTRHPLGPLVVGFLLLAAVGGAISDRANWPTPALADMTRLASGEPAGTAAATGVELWINHLLAVELAGALLLVAIVGAVAAARKPVEPVESATLEGNAKGARDG